MTLLSHLIVVPVVLPLVTAALLVMLGDKRKRAQSITNIGATLIGLVVAVEILRRSDAGASGHVGVYLASNWEAPFGIVLVADRLAALMLVLVGVVSLSAALYAEASWSRVGTHFHPLFQIQLMGLNGAFLTGDLFNLFVFFEVMLAASYGLTLHGSGWRRVTSGLHYIAVNLLASSLFLIGLAVLYGVTGTLSMADIAEKIASVPPGDRGLMHAGMAILAVAFLVKAAVWPLNGWLVPAYTAASAPVAALFALMTKVGFYVLLRTWTLFFSDGPSAGFGAPVLLYGGLATIAFGAIGLLSTMRASRAAGFSIVVSSGTLIAALGMGEPAVTSAALFYLVSATLAVGALFLLVELIERIGASGSPQLSDDTAPDDAAPDDTAPDDTAPDDTASDDTAELGEDTNLDDQQLPLVGRTIPLSLALLGLAFVSCALVVAGLPPLSGFIAKVSLLSSVLAVGADGASSTAPTPAAWAVFASLLAAGLAAIVCLARVGIRYFWTGSRRDAHVKIVEAASVVGLLFSCVMLTVFAEPVLRYTARTAASLHAPSGYIEAVRAARPRPGPTRTDVDREASQ
jgi:multicomponent K+:H+ antiporter subunit D